MILSVLRFVYPPPQNLFVTAMSVISLVLLVNGGIRELKGKHVQYSKLLNFGNDQRNSADKKAKISSKTGMIIAYTPAFLAGFGSFILLLVGDFRFNLLRSTVTVNFFKRVVEDEDGILSIMEGILAAVVKL